MLNNHHLPWRRIGAESHLLGYLLETEPLGSDLSLGAAKGRPLGSDLSLGAAKGRPLGSDLSLGATGGRPLGSDPSLGATGGRPLGSDPSLGATGGRPLGSDLSLGAAGGRPLGSDPKERNVPPGVGLVLLKERNVPLRVGLALLKERNVPLRVGLALLKERNVPLRVGLALLKGRNVLLRIGLALLKGRNVPPGVGPLLLKKELPLPQGKKAMALCFCLLLGWGIPSQGFPQSPAEPAQAESAEAEPGEELPPGEDLPLYLLPEADVSEDRDTPERITPEELERYDAQDLWEAVRQVPGVLLSGGGRRNDSNFTVRGFGPDSVPIFVDGIVVANTYRGEGDAARYLTGDLESITIQKGYSSPLLGANTLGGAVLLQTAKPKDPLELSLKTSVDLDDTGAFNGATHVISAGGKGERLYGKTVFQYRGVDHYRLSADFEPTRGNPQEEGNRLWSDSTDMKLTLLGGIRPFSFLDLWLTGLYQDSDKGISPPDVNIRDIYIWDWPLWKRWSLSLNGVFDRDPLTLKTVVYFDKYDNRLDEYFNWAAFQHGVHNAHSDYDEYSTGGRLEGTWNINAWNQFSAALIFKQEDHIGLHGETQDVHITEDTWSFGTEYVVNPPWVPKLRASGGLGFDLLVPQVFDGVTNRLMQELGESWYVVQSRKMLLLNAQAGLFYDFTSQHQVRLTYARKNRFPTMFQRYSTRMGRVLPNPRLGPETAHHFELGYRGILGERLTVNSALYYSRLKGKIVTVPVPNPKAAYLSVDFSRNLDETSLYGLELNGELYLNEYLSGGASLSLGGYTINHSESQIVSLPYYPAKSANLYGEFRPAPLLAFLGRLEYLDDQYIDALGEEILDHYWLVHLKLTVNFSRHLKVSAGIENLLDTYYEIRQNAPQAGRTYTLSCTLQY